MAEIKNFPNNVDEYIGAENVMKWLHGRSSGVFGADGNLSVTANGDMTVSVSDGVGWLANDKADGTVFWNDTKEQTGSELQLTIPLPDAILPRIDRIVVSWDTVNYAEKPRIEVLKGTTNSVPTPPKLTNDTLKRQISLAQINVAAAASKIDADNITDDRLDGTVCGLVTDWVTVDTTTMQGQFSEFLAQIKKELDMLHAGTNTMTKNEYDPDSEVSDAGGIKAYTKAQTDVLAADITKVNNTLANLQYLNAGAHNAIYRGKYLGASVTAAQYAAIKAGTFDNLFIGDYWTIDGVNYRIAAFDYYLNCGDTACTTHHVVIVPDTCLYTAQMHNTSSGGYEGGAANTTVGGYVGSDMYKTNLANAKTTIKSAFNGHVLNHRIFLTNAVANGRASNIVWCDSEVDLMCEQMVYGSGIFSPVSDGSNIPANFRVEKSQLPLFQHEQSRIFNHEIWWLRDVISASNFAIIGTGGNADQYGASDSLGVRPAFCIS